MDDTFDTMRSPLLSPIHIHTSTLTRILPTDVREIIQGILIEKSVKVILLFFLTKYLKI